MHLNATLISINISKNRNLVNEVIHVGTYLRSLSIGLSKIFIPKWIAFSNAQGFVFHSYRYSCFSNLAKFIMCKRFFLTLNDFLVGTKWTFITKESRLSVFAIDISVAIQFLNYLSVLIDVLFLKQLQSYKTFSKHSFSPTVNGQIVDSHRKQTKPQGIPVQIGHRPCRNPFPKLINFVPHISTRSSVCFCTVTGRLLDEQHTINSSQSPTAHCPRQWY